MMSRRARVAVWSGLVILALIVVARLLPDPFTTSEDREFARQFETIRPGMTRAQVLAILGQARVEGSEFHLGQKEGFEEEYALAARSGSKYYLFWQKATDLTYASGGGTLRRRRIR
jgi:hypothetical protein